ncbi:uncharacterized protein LOC135945504 [Cloeon dipterum]|uniref:uncharacterized protein LOC135945504 n=1 Tax=Cloeon dipterum TaxID=197152 RepID=UPI003220199D
MPQGGNNTTMSGSGGYKNSSPKPQNIWLQIIWPQKGIAPPDVKLGQLFQPLQLQDQQGAQLDNAAQQQPDGGQQVVEPPAQSPAQAQQQQPGVQPSGLQPNSNVLMLDS